MSKKTTSSQPAFTFIELMITISIIAIIATVSVVSFNGVRSKQRDAQRLADIKKITLGLERYKNLYGDFPDCTSHYICDYGTDNLWITCLEDKLKPFIGNIPIDPGRQVGVGYCYQIGYNSSGNQVSLVYSLENENPNASYLGSLSTLYDSYGASVYSLIIQRYRD